jgi:hypothetical protein
MKGDFPLQFLDSRVSQRAQPSLIGSASHPPAPTAALLLTNKVCVLSAIAHCMHEPVGPAPVMTAVPSVLGSAPVLPRTAAGQTDGQAWAAPPSFVVASLDTSRQLRV